MQLSLSMCTTGTGTLKDANFFMDKVWLQTIAIDTLKGANFFMDKIWLQTTAIGILKGANFLWIRFD